MNITRFREKVKEIRLMWKILLFTLGGLLEFQILTPGGPEILMSNFNTRWQQEDFFFNFRKLKIWI